jgi:hypothetical protein
MAPLAFHTPASWTGRHRLEAEAHSRYRSGRSPDWIKSKNPAAPAVRREANAMPQHFYLAPRREDYERFSATMIDRDELHETFD